MFKHLKYTLSSENTRRLAKELLRQLDEQDAKRETLNTPLRLSSRHLGPPKNAEFLLWLFLTRSDRMVVPDDLEEEFTTGILPELGARRARLWYWEQITRTILYRNPLCRRLLTGGSVHKSIPGNTWGTGLPDVISNLERRKDLLRAKLAQDENE